MALLVSTRWYWYIGGVTQESIDQAAEAEQVFRRAGELRILGRPVGGVEVRPLGRDQRLTSVRQNQNELLEKTAILGDPDLPAASTSHVERKNGTLRQWCKRLTRLTYAFSKKWDNLKAALALHFAYYNFCRIHGSLRIMPAMAAGITDHVWSLAELLAEGAM